MGLQRETAGRGAMTIYVQVRRSQREKKNLRVKLTIISSDDADYLRNHP